MSKPGEHPLHGRPPQARPAEAKMDIQDNTDFRLNRGEGVAAAPSTGPLKFEETTTQEFGDGTRVVKFSKPQKLQRLIGEAKKEIGSQAARFHGKGWVIARGGGLARIAEDGTSITYYPPEVAQLVEDLLGPES